MAPAAWSSAPASADAPCRGYMRLMISCSRRSASLNLPMATTMAAICALKPPGSPRCARACSSSWIQICCCATSSFCLRARTALRVAITSAWRNFISSACRLSISSLSAPSSPLLFMSAVLAFPYPQSRAIPTVACLRAPTSLPPSPHISTWCAFRCCRALMTFALPGGDMRAKTRISSMSSQNRSSSAHAASMAASVTSSWYRVLSSCTFAASKGSDLRSVPTASTHRTSPASSVRSIAGRSVVQMPTSLATWSAVRGASPVSMATRWSERMRDEMTVSESARVLHAKAMKPSNCRSLSTQSREAASPPPAGHHFDARASTRMPSSAMAR
mmetsp:Transcript_67444/g.119581  ORF Transcript_67444/g.119581 Transcript_67444/m.119581 type:complete len:331 (-) Transcript_67444:2557-3549(-)